MSSRTIVAFSPSLSEARFDSRSLPGSGDAGTRGGARPHSTRKTRLAEAEGVGGVIVIADPLLATNEPTMNDEL